MRTPISLSGTWQFQLDPDGLLTPASLAPQQTIPVPLPWQAAFPELRQYSGYAWYRRMVDINEDWLNGELLLHFGAVDYWCQVFMNGQLVGEHEGGYMPFTLPVTRYARADENEITVRVYDAAQQGLSLQRFPAKADSASQPPFNPADIPHGKQEWYINVGGLWQAVTLTPVSKLYIDTLHVTPNRHTGTAALAVKLAGDLASADGNLQLWIEDAGGGTWQASVPLISGQANYETSVTVEAPQLWETESPYLYTARATVSTHSGEDEKQIRFGFREIAACNGQLFLNGQPLFLLAALDQDLYPDTIYTPPSDAYLRDQFLKAKALGLNTLRCHIKPPDPRYLDLADEMGLLVWTEIPSWRTFYQKGSRLPEQRDLSEIIKRRAEQTLDEMIQRDYNHPSIIIWTLVNEDWGTTLALSAADRAWVAELYERCQRLDATRLIVDNSACMNAWGPNVHVRSDLDDFHVYANIPDNADDFENMIEQFGLRPLWTYAGDGSAQRGGGEPLILSEFGNWGLPSLQALRAPTGSDPHWFDTGPWWSGWEGEPGWPAGVEERFGRFGLTAAFPNYEAFATATQWHQFTAMKFEIETMRRQPALAGYVITEFTDAYWESNGLLDFLRNPKAYHDEMAAINAPDVIIPQVARHMYWDDETVTAGLMISHYGSANWAGAKLRWRLNGSALTGERLLPEIGRGQVVPLQDEAWLMPKVSAAETVRIVLEAGAESVLAHTNIDVLVLPSSTRHPTYSGEVAVIAPNSNLETSLQNIGYRTQTQITTDTKVVVSTRPNAELLAWVRGGGDLFFICSGYSPFFWAAGRGGIYSGNWLTNFSWLRPAAHRRLGAVTNPLGMPFRQVMPRHTLLGVPVEDPAVHNDILAGMIAGWVNHPAVHTLQFNYGAGRVLMTTFVLQTALPHNPAAVAMVHDLLEHLTSPACQPVLTANY